MWQCTCGMFALGIIEGSFYFPLKIPYEKMKTFNNVEGPRSNYIGLLSTSMSTIGCDHNS